MAVRNWISVGSWHLRSDNGVDSVTLCRKTGVSEGSSQPCRNKTATCPLVTISWALKVAQWLVLLNCADYITTLLGSLALQRCVRAKILTSRTFRISDWLNRMIKQNHAAVKQLNRLINNFIKSKAEGWGTAVLPTKNQSQTPPPPRPFEIPMANDW